MTHRLLLQIKRKKSTLEVKNLTNSCLDSRISSRIQSLSKKRSLIYINVKISKKPKTFKAATMYSFCSL